ncbi:glutathione S-transferase family protein [Aspergillus lucknowensis]|uniref:GST C-terminal domain-containing protein n=1 Tax=Aspergillus lucknowensis TaxID=176173 RepID=A0ABR4LFH6_9EURO
MSSNHPVILFHYPHSPFSARVLYYLALRGIPYDQCIQPQILPRSDLARLGIRYRRIPLLSIGRDVYLDSRLILERLERLGAPNPPFASTATPEQRGLERLLASFTLDTGLFKSIVQVLLPHTPLLHNEAFLKDRTEMIGAPPGYNFADFLLAGGADALMAVKGALEVLETTLLADGREWLAGTREPGRADIEAVWSIQWLFSVPGALPGEYISARIFPKVFAWVERFEKAVSVAQKGFRRPETFSGEQVADILGKAAVSEAADVVDESDPLVRAERLRKGQVVQLWPTDSGSRHKTVGRLLGLTAREITIETTGGEVSVRVHAPRQGFRVAALAKANLS